MVKCATKVSRLYAKSAVSESSITLARLNLTYKPLGMSPSTWHTFSSCSCMATKHCLRYLIVAQILSSVMVFQSQKNGEKSSLNLKDHNLVRGQKFFRQCFVDVPFFICSSFSCYSKFHAKVRPSVWRSLFCIKLKVTEKGPLCPCGVF